MTVFAPSVDLKTVLEIRIIFRIFIAVVVFSILLGEDE